MSLLQLHVHVTVLVLLVSETRQFSSVSSSHFGTFDFAELENAAYEVDIASTPMSELQFEVSECVCVYVCGWEGGSVYVCKEKGVSRIILVADQTSRGVSAKIMHTKL